MFSLEPVPAPPQKRFETDIEALKVHGGTTIDTHRLFSADRNLKYLATEGLVWSVVAPRVGDAY